MNYMQLPEQLSEQQIALHGGRECLLGRFEQTNHNSCLVFLKLCMSSSRATITLPAIAFGKTASEIPESPAVQLIRNHKYMPVVRNARQLKFVVHEYGFNT